MGRFSPNQRKIAKRRIKLVKKRYIFLRFPPQVVMQILDMVASSALISLDSLLETGATSPTRNKKRRNGSTASLNRGQLL